MTALIDSIRAENRQFMDLLKRGDSAGIAGLYTANARLLPPDVAMMSGTDAIRSFWQGAIDVGFKEARLETVSVEARDDLAYEIGNYELTLKPASGEEAKVAGKYVVIWQNCDGRWKLHVDIWNAGTS